MSVIVKVVKQAFAKMSVDQVKTECLKIGNSCSSSIPRTQGLSCWCLQAGEWTG